MSYHRLASGYFIIAGAALIAIAPAARAQDAFTATSAAHVRDEFASDMDTLHVKIVALAKAIPADKYAWRPAPGTRSISEALMHVVGEWSFFAPMSMAGKPPADFGAPQEKLPALEKNITSKDAVIAELEKSWTHCATQLRAADASTLTGKYKPWGMPVDAAAFAMSGDLHEHLGQWIAYARSVGVKPPWSK